MCVNIFFSVKHFVNVAFRVRSYKTYNRSWVSLACVVNTGVGLGVGVNELGDLSLSHDVLVLFLLLRIS